MPGSLKSLQDTARERKNVFEQLMEAVKYNSLGQISHALYEVGGVSEEYVRSKSPSAFVRYNARFERKQEWLCQRTTNS